MNPDLQEIVQTVRCSNTESVVCHRRYIERMWRNKATSSNQSSLMGSLSNGSAVLLMLLDQNDALIDNLILAHGLLRKLILKIVFPTIWMLLLTYGVIHVWASFRSRSFLFLEARLGRYFRQHEKGDKLYAGIVCISHWTDILHKQLSALVYAFGLCIYILDSEFGIPFTCCTSHWTFKTLK